MMSPEFRGLGLAVLGVRCSYHHRPLVGATANVFPLVLPKVPFPRVHRRGFLPHTVVRYVPSFKPDSIRSHRLALVRLRDIVGAYIYRFVRLNEYHHTKGFCVRP